MKLTARQQQVVVLLADGLTYREISDHLGIAQRTVRKHVLGIAAKLPGSGKPQRRIVRHLAYLLAA